MAVKITDFGLAKDLAATNGQTQTGALLGTPQYMAPEQAEGNVRAVGPLADVYALGGILYYLLTGRPPVQGIDFMEILEQVRCQEPVPPRQLQPRIPRDLETICLKCLAKSPSQRYASAAELAADLRRFLAGESIRARPPSIIERGARWARRRPALASTLAASALASAVLICVLLLSNWQIRYEQAETARVNRELQDTNVKLNTLNTELGEANQRITQEQAQTTQALADRTAALEREELTGYYQRISLARNEWMSNNIGQVRRLLEDCPPKLRHWEWHYLLRLCATEQTRLPTDSSDLTGVVRSPDGQALALIGQDGKVRVLNPRTGAILFDHAEIGHTGRAIDFSRDGQRLAAAFGQPQTSAAIVRVWNATTWQPVDEWREPAFQTQCLAFSPDGKSLILSGAIPKQRGSDIRLRELATGTVKRILENPSQIVRTFAYSPDGRYLATCTNRGEVQIWDAKTGAEHGAIPHDETVLHCLAFGPSDGRLYVAGSLGTIRCWDVAGNKQIASSFSYSAIFKDLAVSPDGQLLALGSSNGMIRLFNAQTLQEKAVLGGHEEPVAGLVFVEPFKLASGGDDGTLRLWETRQPQSTAVFGAKAPPQAATAGHSWRFEDAARASRLCNMATGAPTFARSPDGKLLIRFVTAPAAVAEADRKQRFLQIQDNRADLTLDGGPPACAAFSGDGRLFATGTMNGLVLLWDVHESKLRHELRNGRLPIQNVAFDDPGRLLAGLSRSNQVVFWDTQSGLESVPLQLPTGNQAYGLALHPRDRVFAVGLADGAIEIRTGTDNRLLRTLGKHNAQVLALAYLADGQRLLSRDHEGVCKLWDPATGREVLTLIHSSQRGP